MAAILQLFSYPNPLPRNLKKYSPDPSLPSMLLLPPTSRHLDSFLDHLVAGSVLHKRQIFHFR